MEGEQRTAIANNRPTFIFKTKTTEKGSTTIKNGSRASIGKRNMNPSRSRGYC